MKTNGKDSAQYIYLIISETPSRFGRVIRFITKTKYNHASLAFDEDLRELYSFGRRQNKVPLNAGLVWEYPERFSLGKVDCVNVRIYKIPVTMNQYLRGKKRIKQIKNDPDGYLYNLFSVLSFPIFHGFHTYKAFSCAEFVAHMLNYMGVELQGDKREFEYTPEEIGDSMPSKVLFEGNLLDYCNYEHPVPESFFENPRYFRATFISCNVITRLVYRKFRHTTA